MTVDRPAARSIGGGYALKVLAGVEVLVAALLTYVALRSLWGTLLGPADPLEAAHEEWSPVVLMVTAPIAASLWLTVVALLRNWRSRWMLHAIPPAVVICMWLILLGLDRGLL